MGRYLGLFLIGSLASTALHTMPDVSRAQDRSLELTPELVLRSWQQWARDFASLAWEGEIHEDYVERQERHDRASSDYVRESGSEEHPSPTEITEGNLKIFFLGKWPVVLWEMTVTETVKKPGQSPTRSVVRKGVLVRDGTIYTLTGSDAGWVIRKVTSLYDPKHPPSFWESLEELWRYYLPFDFLLNRGVRRWREPLQGGHIHFDATRRVTEGVEVVWHIALDKLPRDQVGDLMPYSKGRWVLNPQYAWFPVQAETTGQLVDGSPSRVVTTARYESYGGIPVQVERHTELVFGPDENQLVARSRGTRQVTIRKVSPTLDRSRLTLAYFELPNDVRVGPPSGGVPRWQRLLGAAVALLICGAVLAWWLRSRSTA